VSEGFESDERDIASLSRVVAAWYVGFLWLKLMFIATHFINLECALSYMIGSEIFDVYLAMTCSMVLLILLFESIKNLSVYFKTKKKLKCVYRYLSRMKQALILYEWCQADNITRYKCKIQTGTQQDGLRKKNYCPRMYARTKSLQISNVRTKSWTHGYVILQAMCTTANCCQGMSTRPCEFVSDTDSFLIGLDNNATCYMENDVNNFVTKLTPTPNIRVRGVGNQLMMAKGIGMVLCKIEDDNGVVHEKLFPGTLFIPDLRLCLLSPQSWCQSADDHFPRQDGT
jgi:hypothetical protein